MKANTGRIDFLNDPTFHQAMERFAALTPYIILACYQELG